MLSKISFALVNDRARYSHFKRDGLMEAVADIQDLEEAFVGAHADDGPPNEAQLSSVLLLAEIATTKNPNVQLFFAPGTSPFQPPIIERQVTLPLGEPCPA